MPPSPRRRLISTLLGVVGGCLALFHLELLRVRIAEGALLRPGVAGRWLAAVLLFTALYRLRQALWGRRALGVWTLVALLHAVPAGEPQTEPRRPDALPATVALALSLLAAGLARAVRSAVPRPPTATPVRASARLPRRPPLFRHSWSARPPPTAVA